VGDLAPRDGQSVTAAGERLEGRIDGVVLRPVTIHIDERGTLTELLRSDAEDDPLVQVYTATIRPGQVKGWAVHLKKQDRLFLASGVAKVALYDGRVGSPTEGIVDVRFVGNENRGLLFIPAGVYHAIRNIGLDDVLFVNMPTTAYDHENPDKYRLPVDNELIPYTI
jgi:dTDP-4-dehydrorhamnose 3,5-epimerase